MIYVWLALAFGGDLSWNPEPPDRTLKVEFYRYERLPGDPYSSDWRQQDLVFWSALLSCSSVRPNLERCTFVGGKVEHGYQMEGEDFLRVYDIDAPEVMEIKRNRRGRISGDFEGERDAFREQASGAQLARHRKPDRQSLTPDEERRFGQEMEEVLLLAMSSSLALELPADPEATTWKCGAPPAARTFSQSTFVGKAKARLAGYDEDLRLIRIEGRFSEDATLSGAHPARAEGNARSEAWFDTAQGIVVSSKTEVLYERAFVGAFGKRLALLRVAEPSDTFRAGDIEGALVNDSMKRGP